MAGFLIKPLSLFEKLKDPSTLTMVYKSPYLFIMDKFPPNKLIFFKDCFTLKQYTAFSLIFNWILPKADQKKADQKADQNVQQYEKLKNTHHFRKLFQLKNSPNYDFKSLLQELRNYFSHYESASFSSLFCCEQWFKSKSLAEDLIFFVNEAVALLEQRKTKLDPDEAKEKQIKKELHKIKEEPLKFFPLDGDSTEVNIQPALALIAGPFLTKSQMAFLSGRLFAGKNGRDKKEDPEWIAKTKILQTLAQNDRVLSEFEHDRFLSPKKELGLAVWGRLETAGIYNKTQKATVAESFPEDLWFIKQLILYTEHTKALPSVEFARIKTERTEINGSPASSLLEQKTVFDSKHRERPLKIRHNTIEAEVSMKDGSKIRTNFGIQALKYLVSACILKNQSVSVNEFVVDWIQKNRTRKSAGSRAFDKKSLDEKKKQIKKRITSLMKELSTQNINNIKLFDQIRFVCLFLNEAWNKKHGQYMSAEEFKSFQQKVRYYRQRMLREELEKADILDTAGLGLGWNDDKALSCFIVKERIQDVFFDIKQAREDWLKRQQKKVLNGLSEKELLDLARRLSLRNLKEKESKNNLTPVAVKPEDIKTQIRKWQNHTNSELRFFNLIRDLSGGGNKLIPFSLFGLNEADSGIQKAGWGPGKARERWARTGLLLLMVPKLLDRNDLRIQSQKPSEQEVEEDLGEGIKIKFKLTQGWRHYADFNKQQLKKLIKVYHPECRGFLSLLGEKGSTKKSGLGSKQVINKAHTGKRLPEVTVQSLRIKADRERELLMRAILKWEKDVIRDKQISKLDEGYISFTKILSKSGLDQATQDSLKTFRNACMHNDLSDRPFSKAPEPFQSIYKSLAEDEKKKKKSQKIKGRQEKLQKIKNKAYKH